MRGGIAQWTAALNLRAPHARLGVALIASMVLIAALGIIAWHMAAPSLPMEFLQVQDGLVIILMALAAILSLGGAMIVPAATAYPRTRWLAVGLAFFILAGWVGRFLILGGHDMTVDEQHASLAAEYLSKGKLFAPVPEAWQPFAYAMKPQYLDSVMRPAAWLSGYLPLNAALQAGGLLLGMKALVQPLLAGLGLVALWDITGQLWPTRRDVRLVVLLLAVSSAQLLLTAMTSYGMTSLFAFDTLWLACFLRDRPKWHAAAMIVGFAATGLHHVHTHLLVIAPFLLLLLWRGRWGVALAYACAYGITAFFWIRYYPGHLHAMVAGVGPPVVHGDTHTMGQMIAGSDVAQWVMGSVQKALSEPRQPFYFSLSVLNFLRFVTWQSLLLMPLVGLAAVALVKNRRAPGADLIVALFGCVLIGFSFMVYQAHGWGYRYFHGLIAIFCLLGGYGWESLGKPQMLGGARRIATMAFAITLLVLVPLRAVQARDWAMPYARAAQAIRQAHADIVFVDHRYALFAQDLVENGADFTAHPKVMQLSLLSARQVDFLCHHFRIAVADNALFRDAGLIQTVGWGPGYSEAGTLRTQMDNSHCGQPIRLK